MPAPRDTIVHRWFEEVWNKGRASAIDEMLAEDAMVYGLAEAGVDVRGPAGFKPFHEKLRGAFPDIHVTVEDTIEQGDLIASRWTVRMTHTGDDLGVQATGRRVTATGMTIARVRDGKIVEGWNNWDTLALMQQIGAFHPTVALLDAPA